MSKQVVEYILSRYDVISREKEIVFSVFAEPSDYKTLDSVNRLQKIIKTKTKEAFVFANSFRIIELNRSNNNCNSVNECVHFEKTVSIKNSSYEHKKELDERLNEIAKDKKGIFTASIEPLYKNNYFYTFGSRLVECLTETDKKVKIKRLVSARKGAITRSVNKLKKIEENYKKTLFQNDYKTDKKYMSLKANIDNQKNRLKEAENMTIEEIETIAGAKKFSFFRVDGLFKV